jgi:predicted SnoaL-like aldol condensation-catalyzing enzyme
MAIRPTENINRSENMIKPLLRFGCAIALGLLVIETAWAADAAQMESNKKIVVDFYEKGLNKKDFEAAAQYFGSKYVQHNPNAADGAEGFKALLQMLRDRFPNSHSNIKRVFAEGDYVILHVHTVREPGTRGTAIVDIFRLENGKIVEHWDVRQDVPEKAAHSNGMF